MAKNKLVNAVSAVTGRLVPRHDKPSIPREVRPAAAPTVKIKGSGTMPIYANGAMRRIALGKAIEVSEAEKAFLDYANVPYTEK